MISQVRETMAQPRCYVVHIASCSVSSLHNSLHSLTEDSHQAFTKGQKEEGLILPCMTVTNAPMNNWSEVNMMDFLQ